MKTKKTINLLVFGAVFFFFANFVAQKKDSANVAGYGELTNTNVNSNKNTAVTTTGGTGVFEPTDRLYINENTPNRRFIPYTYLRQADVAWEKRVWRVIDLREKINQPLMFPLFPAQNRMAFLDIIKIGLKSGEITAFVDDEFTSRLTFEQAMAKLVVEVTVNETDSLGNPLSTKTVADTISNQKVTRITLKEDWFFDKQKSVLEVRTLAIGLEWYNEDKELYIPLFNLYMPQCRPLFARNEIYNPKNDAERRTYEDFFW
ncbi:MAG: gliding motility protein GldN, partial [Bacteroidia bacterium]|nr:gliding motility protein GldN [Bacteroidia bacterium]